MWHTRARRRGTMVLALVATGASVEGSGVILEAFIAGTEPTGYPGQ